MEKLKMFYIKVYEMCFLNKQFTKTARCKEKKSGVALAQLSLTSHSKRTFY